MEKKCYAASAETISVIVPVYGVENYLPACIDSILAQTHEDFQLILVDDGSPDRCGEICDEYAAKDSRIVVIHQENGGLSAARNTGIDWVFDNSESRWLNFVDSDDIVSPIYLETLYSHAVENDADISVTGLYYFPDGKDLESIPEEIVSVSVAEGKECCRELMAGQGFFMCVACGKLFRREMFRTVRFPVGRVHEDEAVAPYLLYNARKVAVIRSWLYGYRQRAGSIMQKPFSRKKFDFVVSLDEHIRYFRDCGDAEFIERAVKRKRISWAEIVLSAHKSGAMEEVPAEFRMPLWKAYGITLADTLRRGGVKFLLERMGNLFRKIVGKR